VGAGGRGGGWGGEEGGAEGDRGWDDYTCSKHVPKISMNHTNLGFLGGWAVGGVCIFLEIDRVFRVYFSKTTRRDRG
jgi:hypothetical protein